MSDRQINADRRRGSFNLGHWLPETAKVQEMLLWRGQIVQLARANKFKNPLHSPQSCLMLAELASTRLQRSCPFCTFIS